MRYFITVLFLIVSVHAITPDEIESHYNDKFIEDETGAKNAIVTYLKFQEELDAKHKEFLHKLLINRWAKKLNIDPSSDYSTFVHLSDGSLPLDEILIFDESKNCSIKLIYFTAEDDKDVGEFMYLRCVEQFVKIPKQKKTR
jgi:hypothetical protein